MSISLRGRKQQGNLISSQLVAVFHFTLFLLTSKEHKERCREIAWNSMRFTGCPVPRCCLKSVSECAAKMYRQFILNWFADVGFRIEFREKYLYQVPSMNV